MSNILIIDADENFISMIDREISRIGHEVTSARTILDGLELAVSNSFDAVFLSMDMPDRKGADALPKLLECSSSPEVILVADSGDPDEAEFAVKMGAWDYIQRSAPPKTLVLSLVRALQYRAKKIPRAPCAILKPETIEDIVGNSPQMKQSMEHLTLAAHSDANVLISGETGTGKELFAWAIHSNSKRANRRFVVVDCASLPDNLVESTLFGYEKGAFTGADKAQSGLIKLADGGTLFLDEVGELPISIQKSFLRVLQERRFRPVGGTEEIHSDFRLIAATNRNLDIMAHRRQFRKDLVFRLRAFTMDLPPLRERKEDIREIAAHYMGKFCECYGFDRKKFSTDFFDVLNRYDWPGNVRELVNALERAISAASHEPVIFPKHLPIYIRVSLARASVDPEASLTKEPQLEFEAYEALPSLISVRDEAIAEAEQRYLKELMKLTKDMNEACRISGLSRSRLYALLKKYGIPSCFRI